MGYWIYSEKQKNQELKDKFVKQEQKNNPVEKELEQRKELDEDKNLVIQKLKDKFVKQEQKNNPVGKELEQRKELDEDKAIVECKWGFRTTGDYIKKGVLTVNGRLINKTNEVIKKATITFTLKGSDACIEGGKDIFHNEKIILFTDSYDVYAIPAGTDKNFSTTFTKPLHCGAIVKRNMG